MRACECVACPPLTEHIARGGAGYITAKAVEFRELQQAIKHVKTGAGKAKGKKGGKKGKKGGKKKKGGAKTSKKKGGKKKKKT